MSASIDAVGPTLDDRLRLRERPARRCLMYHSWRDLLFLHWRVEPRLVQLSLPPGLFVDTFDGAAYVGVVPFYMCNIRPRFLPPLPWFSNFLELNVRTYVHDGAGTPGVWFYSLDCNQPLTVWGARKFFHLPYRAARMTAPKNADGRIAFTSQLRHHPLRTSLSHVLQGTPRTAVPGTLEFFLIERYVLFAAASDGRLFTGRVHHPPYPICDAKIGEWSSNLLTRHDFAVDESRFEHVCASPGVEVEVFALEQLRKSPAFAASITVR